MIKLEALTKSDEMLALNYTISGLSSKYKKINIFINKNLV